MTEHYAMFGYNSEKVQIIEGYCYKKNYFFHYFKKKVLSVLLTKMKNNINADLSHSSNK